MALLQSLSNHSVSILCYIQSEDWKNVLTWRGDLYGGDQTRRIEDRKKEGTCVQEICNEHVEHSIRPISIISVKRGL